MTTKSFLMMTKIKFLTPSRVIEMIEEFYEPFELANLQRQLRELKLNEDDD